MKIYILVMQVLRSEELSNSARFSAKRVVIIRFPSLPQTWTLETPLFRQPGIRYI